MRIPTTVNVLGWNGTGEPPDIQDIWRQIVLPQMRAEFPDFKESDLSVEGHPMRRLGTDRVCELLHAWFIAKEHNDTVPKLTAYVLSPGSPRPPSGTSPASTTTCPAARPSTGSPRTTPSSSPPARRAGCSPIASTRPEPCTPARRTS